MAVNPGHFDSDFIAIYQNTRSIKNKVHLLLDAIEENKNKENNYIKAICLSETWITHEQKGLIQVPDYKFAAGFYRKLTTGGGAAILLRNDIDYQERPDIEELSTECIVECCAVNIPKENILLINIYRLDHHIKTFFTFINTLLTKINSLKSKKHIIIGGDFNLDKEKYPTHYEKFINIMLKHNLHLMVTKSTRVTHKTATKLDLLFTNFHDTTQIIQVKDYGISDHKAIYYSIESKNKEKTKTTTHVTKRCFNEKNMRNFRDAIAKINWNEIININSDVNENYNQFENKLKYVLDHHIPLQTFKITDKAKQWMTKGLKISCRHKRMLQILTNESKSKILKTYTKKYQKILKKCVKYYKKINNAKK